MTTRADRRRESLCIAASTWLVLFAAPHAWWALGIPNGFPGGDASYHRFMGSTWRYWYDVGVVVLAVLALALVWRLRRPRLPPPRSQRLARWAVALGGAALTLRGLAGLVVDGRADPIWWPAFLVGGLLLGGVAWSARDPVQVD